MAFYIGFFMRIRQGMICLWFVGQLKSDIFLFRSVEKWTVIARYVFVPFCRKVDS